MRQVLNKIPFPSMYLLQHICIVFKSGCRVLYSCRMILFSSLLL